MKHVFPLPGHDGTILQLYDCAKLMPALLEQVAALCGAMHGRSIEDISFCLDICHSREMNCSGMTTFSSER